jgi:hypothetical protein
MELCRICQSKKAKRRCPGIQGDICPTCCGSEREVTVDCPFDCEYLVESRRHDRLPDVDPDRFPNLDIRTDEQFLRDNEPLVIFSAQALLGAALTAKGIDNDVREALEAMIRTKRTEQSGLIYETKPQNPYAAQIQEKWTQAIEELMRKVHEQTGTHAIRDSQILGVLVFLQRLEIQHNNGRKRGRAFLSFLAEYFAAPPQAAEQDSVQLA